MCFLLFHKTSLDLNEAGLNPTGSLVAGCCDVLCCLSQYGASAAAAREWHSGFSFVLYGPDHDTGGGPSADAEDCAAGLLPW